MFGLTNGLAYIPKEGQWETLWGQISSWGWFSFCVIEKVFYHYRCSNGMIQREDVG